MLIVIAIAVVLILVGSPLSVEDLARKVWSYFR